MNVRTGEVQFSNGGHTNPYIVRHSTGAVEPFPSTEGTLVGKIPHLEYETKKITLQKGDTIFLYTDGASEAMDAGMNLFGEERLEQYLAGTNGATVEEIVQGSIANIKVYCGSAPQSDDITVLTLQFKG